MKIKGLLRMLALLLAVVVALSACDFGGTKTDGTSETTTAIGSAETTAAETTEETTAASTAERLEGYRGEISRSIAEIEEMYSLTEDYFDQATAKLKEFETLALAGQDEDAIDKVSDDFEDMFYHIETQVNIATLIYYYDTTVEENNTEYLKMYEKYGDLYNEYVEICKNVYNNSPIRDVIFADWTEEDIEELFAYSPETQELSQKNEELLVELNALGDAEFNDRAAEIYAELVMNNNRIAELEGYDNYYDYASVEIYGRDYDRDDIAEFRENVKNTILPRMDTLTNGWMDAYYALPTAQSREVYNFLYGSFDKLSKNYLEAYVNSYEGSMYEGFSHMFENRNILFADSPNSHPSAFQMYLTELEHPFCLFGSEGQSTSTIVHEMGHYYAALYNADVSSYDLAETQSQSNELLLLKFLGGEMDPTVYNVVKGYKMYEFAAQSLICVIIDEFEQAVYSLESTEGYTSEDFDAIMTEICESYGGADYLGENVVDIYSYWRLVATNNPVYYISYAVSMMASLSLYATARTDEAGAREIYRILIEETEENETFVAAVERSGLASPFSKETFAKIGFVLIYG